MLELSTNLLLTQKHKLKLRIKKKKGERTTLMQQFKRIKPKIKEPLQAAIASKTKQVVD